MFVVLTGLAGAGKTELLRALRAAGEQVLDLEGLASHRGSAFGGIGERPQPSHAEFARMVERAVAGADRARPLWVEDEGPFIGSVGVPLWLQEQLADAPTVAVRTPVEERVRRLCAAYAAAPSEQLLDALARSSRRLGPELAARAASLVRAGDVEAAVAAVLPWFDGAYVHRMARDRRPVLGALGVPLDPAELARLQSIIASG